MRYHSLSQTIPYRGAEEASVHEAAARPEYRRCDAHYSEVDERARICGMGQSFHASGIGIMPELLASLGSVTTRTITLGKRLAASVGACLPHHLTIGRGLSGCFHHQSIVGSTSRR